MPEQFSSSPDGDDNVPPCHQRSDEMDAEEVRLRYALLTVASKHHGELSVEAMCRTILDLPNTGDDDFLVRRIAPGTFLVILASQGARDGAMRGGTASPATPPELVPGSPSAVKATQPVQATEALTRSIATVGKAGGDKTVLLTEAPVSSTRGMAEANPTTERLPEEETGNELEAPEVSFSDLVAFEEQYPVRGGHESQTMDPMLFEINVLVPKLIRQPNPMQDNDDLQLKTPAPALKTYKRRARSVAAQLGDGTRAVVPAPTLLSFEPSVEPSSSERQQWCEPGAELNPLGEEPATELLAQEAHVVPSVVPPTSKRPRCDESANKRAKTQPNPSVEEAKAVTAAFLASVSQALQAPLASLPGRGGGNGTVPGTPVTPGVRRSRRLVNQPLNATVRASKKGEVLVMRKSGLCPVENPTPEQVHQELAAVFKGPLDPCDFAAIRNIFPAAKALSDADLMAAIRGDGAISVC
ncbi:unnamed protein product [Urochloa humidicola]